MTRPDIPVTISGNSKAFEAAMQRVRNVSRSAAAEVGDAFNRVKSKIGSLSGAVGALSSGPGGLAAVLGVGALVSASQQAVTAVLDIGKAAKTAGIGFEAFQELKYAAEQNRIGVDALSDGLKELQLRADEFVSTGGGPAAESFARIGMTARSVADALKQPDKMFETVIDKIRTLDKAAQIRVLDELFGGTAAEQFVAFLDDGVRKIGELRTEARDVGVVMNRDLLAKAEEVNRAWDKMATIVGTRVKSSVVSVLDVTINLLTKIDEFSDYLGRLGNSDVFKKFLTAIGEDPSKVYRVVPGVGIVEDTSGKPAKTTPKAPVSTPTGTRLPSAVDIMRQAMDEAQATQRIEDAFAKNSSSSERTGKTSGKAKLKEERDAIKDVIDALKEEIEVIGLSETEKEKVIALRRAGVDATSAEGKEISALVEQKYREQQAIDAVTEARERGIEAAESFGATLDDQMGKIIDGTFDARDAVRALVQELISAATGGKGLFESLFSAGASSGGSGNIFSGILSSLFGGARAEGGSYSPGRIYRVNERGDEYFEPSSHGKIYPAGVTPEGGGMTFSFSPTIDARGADQAAVERLEKGLAKANAELEARIMRVVRARPQKGW
ncbi:hypothetical protein SAMN05892877_105358 [Rhizobium subbaraonis]|uniref:Tail length tape measure protein n=1 Tax=Rhizobium subbaraonis TaxID=908946 RepID=A0A285UBB1_9HYPH|nr:tail tape measure protein [Rhizobium subbaraonis]SOC38977.1 hypothetical protein SAMN05892877_105358 [Rhizobium subbaraonis]